jgi:hypothetical protein
MTKRNLELEVEVIDELLATLKALAKQGLLAQRVAEKREVELPEEVQQTIARLASLYKKVAHANKKVEVAELEALFALNFEGEPSTSK